MINIQSVYKSFNGIQVLEDINLKIDFGQIYCLLGKNGVGKTTIFNLILDLIRPDKGEIEVFSRPSNKLEIGQKKKIGVVREDLSLVNELTGFDYLLLIGYLYQIPRPIIEEQISELGEFFLGKENNALGNRIRNCSYGTKKKISLISAFLNSPEILILDEPFSGLDPSSSRKLIAHLLDYSNTKRIVLLASHNLNYIQQISTHIGILHRKKLIFNSGINELPIKEGELIEDVFCRMTEA